MGLAAGTFIIKCKQCGKGYTFNENDAEFDQISGSERQMGPESCYAWQHAFTCDCGQEIEIDYQVWEYPMGAFNMDNVDLVGAEEVSRYDYNFHGDPEPD